MIFSVEVQHRFVVAVEARRRRSDAQSSCILTSEVPFEPVLCFYDCCEVCDGLEIKTGLV